MRTDSIPLVDRQGGSELRFSRPSSEIRRLRLPFSFRYFDHFYDALYVSTEGYVSFDAQMVQQENRAVPNYDSVNNIIALFWDNWFTPNVKYFVDGVAPDRVFTVQLNSGAHDTDRSSGRPLIQLRLFEGPEGRFEVHYGEVFRMENPEYWSASAGFEDASGLHGQTWLTCSPNCSGSDLAALSHTQFRYEIDRGVEIMAASLMTPPQVLLGSSFELSLSIWSQHAATTGPFDYAVYLERTDAAVVPIPIAQGELTLEPYQRAQLELTSTVPNTLSAGRYRAFLLVDGRGEIWEANEANNRRYATTEIELRAAFADLVATHVQVPSSEAIAGSPLNVVLQMANHGDLASDVHYGIYFSRNRVVTTTDVEVRRATSHLAAGASVNLSETVDIPPELLAGRYYVGVLLDPENSVQESNELNNAAVSTLPLNVQNGPLHMVTSWLPLGYEASEYSTHLQAAGADGQYHWAIESGALPENFSLLQSTGELLGQPRAAGVYQFVVRASAGNGESVLWPLTLEVLPRDHGIAIADRAFPPGTAGRPYPGVVAESRGLNVVGAQGPFKFTLLSELPQGLVFDEQGRLTGTPLVSGDYLLEVEVQDAVSRHTRILPMTIAEPGHLTLAVAELGTVHVGQYFQTQLYAVSGLSGMRLFVAMDVLPPGISMTYDGHLSGTPEVRGVWSFAVMAAEDINGELVKDTATFTLKVVAQDELDLSFEGAHESAVGVPYHASLRVLAGQAPYQWDMTRLRLPSGLSATPDPSDSSRLDIQGVFEAVGPVHLLVGVEDAAGRDGLQSVSIFVDTPVSPAVSKGCLCLGAVTISPTSFWAGLLVPLFVAYRWRKRRSAEQA